jgi:hypothetical protein
MDPVAVLMTVWRHRRYAAPAVVISVVAVLYVLGFAPRSYEATASYALVNPQVPTESEMLDDPALRELDNDNPYLRSSDPNLIADALITRLNASGTGERLKRLGAAGAEHSVAPGVGGNGFVIDIRTTGTTPDGAVLASEHLGTVLEDELRALQTINGASERFLFTPLVIAAPDGATERLSSRLRAATIALLGGCVLVFGAVSLGRAREAAAGASAVADGADRDHVRDLVASGASSWGARDTV